MIKQLGIGLLLGFVISRIGFHDYDELNNMFSLKDVRMILSFALAVAIIIAINILRKNIKTKLKFQPGMIFGSILFGIGWALTAGCPAISFIQIAHGNLAALITLTGLVTGMYSYRTLNRRLFKWKITSCAGE